MWRPTQYHGDRKERGCSRSIVEFDRILKFGKAAPSELDDDSLTSPVKPKHIADNFINTSN
jgi:hypothetical protein